MKTEFHPEGAHTTPIFQTGTFQFESLKEAAEKFEGKRPGFIYTRFDNPNFRTVEEIIASLEGGEDALMFSSGMSAILAVALNLTQKGGLLIHGQTLYGCTDELFTNILPSFGIKTDFVDTRFPERVKGAIELGILQDFKRILVFLETPANPTLILADIAKIAKIIAEINKKCETKIMLAVDNSFASPFNQRPLELGADLVIHSVTKYLNGHGDIIQGAVAGTRNLLREKRQSLFHWRAIMGLNPSPFDCWLAERGLKTFGLRIERHNSNAMELAEFLENHPMVKKVVYPGLKSHPQYELAKKQMSPGFGGMISFELKGGKRNIRKFLNNIDISLAVSLGYDDTLIQSPALMTHSLIPRDERLKKGITDSLIRLSVGIEKYEKLEKLFKKSLDLLK